MDFNTLRPNLLLNLLKRRLHLVLKCIPAVAGEQIFGQAKATSEANKRVRCGMKTVPKGNLDFDYLRNNDFRDGKCGSDN